MAACLELARRSAMRLKADELKEENQWRTSPLFRSTARASCSRRTDATQPRGCAGLRPDARSRLLRSSRRRERLNATFYAERARPARRHAGAAQTVEPEFLAKTAIYARERGYMKDMPALLLAWPVARADPTLFEPRFRPRDRQRQDAAHLRADHAVGRDGPQVARHAAEADGPGLAGAGGGREILRAVGRARPVAGRRDQDGAPEAGDASREALYGYLIGKPYDVAALPEVVAGVRGVQARSVAARVPDVPFQMLTALPLAKEQWAQIARNGRLADAAA